MNLSHAALTRVELEFLLSTCALFHKNWFCDPIDVNPPLGTLLLDAPSFPLQRVTTILWAGGGRCGSASISLSVLPCGT